MSHSQSDTTDEMLSAIMAAILQLRESQAQTNTSLIRLDNRVSAQESGVREILMRPASVVHQNAPNPSNLLLEGNCSSAGQSTAFAQNTEGRDTPEFMVVFSYHLCADRTAKITEAIEAEAQASGFRDPALVDIDKLRSENVEIRKDLHNIGSGQQSLESRIEALELSQTQTSPRTGLDGFLFNCSSEGNRIMSLVKPGNVKNSQTPPTTRSSRKVSSLDETVAADLNGRLSSLEFRLSNYELRKHYEDTIDSMGTIEQLEIAGRRLTREMFGRPVRKRQYKVDQDTLFLLRVRVIRRLASFEADGQAFKKLKQAAVLLGDDSD
ncbi:hypothetical protein BJ546DRAFT_950097 [Cryomyces antarcticus]|uniref:Pericentrin/AKAP-450 centrosomal targeting domain-containing protein n=1 Tax=Cryomyces antarcticus TaxID=329879 RepID=A0ABR0LN10_9PEZI|nr:hypothetical protein LTR16_004757 [Cryomyces antarcticus]